MTYHLATKSWASALYPAGNVGGAPCTIAVSCAKTLANVSGGYG